MKRLASLVFVLLWASEALCSTFYVSPVGSDAKPGTSSSPFGTIRKALSLAKPGDTVQMLAGIYGETVAFPRSGSASTPITLQGQKDASGNLLTILDPSVPAPAHWVLAPEIGPHVWKQGFPTIPYVLLLDGQQLLRIDDRRMAEAPGTSPWTGADNLARASDATVPGYADHPVGFWAGIGCLYGCRNGNVYLRFQNGDNPNGAHLRTAGITPAISITSQSFITVQNLHVRGAAMGVSICGHADNNVIQGNLLEHGAYRVRIYKGTDGKPRNNLVRSNILTLGYRDFHDFGAWSMSGSPIGANLMLRAQSYLNFKFLSGYQSSNDCGVQLDYAGSGNEISGNIIRDGLVGLSIWSPNTVVHNNVIRNMSSVGIIVNPGSNGTTITRNAILNTNCNLRIGLCGEVGDMRRSIFFHDNISYLDDHVGSHIYFHTDADYSANIQKGTARDVEVVYVRNKCAGGYSWLETDVSCTASSYVLNNILSSQILVLTNRANIKNARLFAAFDVNWCGGYYWHGVQAFAGPHNVMLPYTNADPTADYAAGDVGNRFWPAGTVPSWNW